MTRSSFCTSSTRAFAENRALMQDGDLAGDLADEGHVVFDDDDAVFAFEAQQQFAGFVGLLVGHAGGGFIHQEQFGVLREQHADFQPLFLAVAQRAGFVSALPSSATVSRTSVDAVAPAPG